MNGVELIQQLWSREECGWECALTSIEHALGADEDGSDRSQAQSFTHSLGRVENNDQYPTCDKLCDR